MDIERQLGYLIAKVEEQGADLNRMAQKLDILEERVDQKFKTAEATFRVFKGIGLILVAVLTFKFGDIANAWQKLF